MNTTNQKGNESGPTHHSELHRIQELEEHLRAAEARLAAAQAAASAAEAAREAAEHELEDVARFLSHDLRAPLRGIDGYSKALVEDYGSQLDNMALAYLQYISESGQLAAAVVEKLIQYIRTPRTSIEIQPVDLSVEARELVDRMHSHQPERNVCVTIEPGLTATADPKLMHLLMEYLLENAWKFTGKQPEAQIEVAHSNHDQPGVYVVRDNGAGFNMAYMDKLFQPFQRLHSAHEFEGAGMGLAVARRIVERHGGRIWAEGEVGKGAALYFTLEPENSK